MIFVTGSGSESGKENSNVSESVSASAIVIRVPAPAPADSRFSAMVTTRDGETLAAANPEMLVAITRMGRETVPDLGPAPEVEAVTIRWPGLEITLVVDGIPGAEAVATPTIGIGRGDGALDPKGKESVCVILLVGLLRV